MLARVASTRPILANIMFNILNHRIDATQTTQEAIQAGAVLGSDAQSLERTHAEGEGRGQMPFPIPYLTPLLVRNSKGVLC